eukprot:407357-Pleurochrysis_carterae.AAC.5
MASSSSRCSFCSDVVAAERLRSVAVSEARGGSDAYLEQAPPQWMALPNQASALPASQGARETAPARSKLQWFECWSKGRRCSGCSGV